MPKLGTRGHVLLTKADEAKLVKAANRKEGTDPQVLVKFFCPYTGFRYYFTEGERTEDDFLFYGYCTGTPNHEWGYSSLAEFEDAKVFGNVPAIERDCWWTPVPASQIVSGEKY